MAIFKNIVVISLASGFAATLFLFYVMAQLISQPAKLDKNIYADKAINFIRQVPNSQLNQRKRAVPKKPLAEKPIPKMPRLSVSKPSTDSTPQPMMNAPTVSDLALGTGPYLGGGFGGSGNSDRDAIPLVRIDPIFPRKAALLGKEGQVKVKFDVNPAGEVINVRILEASPPQLFNRAAKKTIYQWKYRPKVIDGKPVSQKGLEVLLVFKLRNQQ